MYSSDNTEVQFKTIRVHFMDKLSLFTHAYVTIYHGKSCSDTRRQAHIYRPQRSWGKVIFSQECVILFTGGSTSVHAGIPPPPRLGAPRAEHAGRYSQHAGGTHPTGMQSCWIFVFFMNTTTTFLPPAMKLGQGCVFTRVCDSVHREVGLGVGAVVSQHALHGGVVSRPTPGGSIPTCTEAAPPPRLLLRAVRILLECILALNMSKTLS